MKTIILSITQKITPPICNLIIICLFPLFSLAQSNNHYVQKKDTQFALLPHAPTGILYNRVAPLANLVNFTPTQTVKSDYFKQAWFELYFASYNDEQLVSSSRLDSLSRYYSLNGTLIIGAINESFNYFDSTAFTTGQLMQSTNGIIQPQTPHFSYKQKWLGMAGVVYNADWLKKVNAITLPEKALFGKAGVPIKKATILFNNGSYNALSYTIN